MCTIIITTLITAGSLVGAGWIYLFHHPIIKWGSLSAILLAVAVSIYFLASTMT